MKIRFFWLFILVCNLCLSQNITTRELNATRTYEVTAELFSENTLVSVWMEARPDREPSSQAGEMRIAYRSSSDLGESWTEKKIIDDPETLLFGNPYLTTDEEGKGYMILMSVNRDFFSGNLSFYVWDPPQCEFHLKSVAMVTDNTLLDKPAIAFSAQKMYLTYIEYSNTLERGDLKLQVSSDYGNTWSAAQKVTKDNIIYLGPSLRSRDNQLFMASGTYWDKNIYFSRERIDNNTERFSQGLQVVAGIPESLGSALTELAVNDGGDIAIGWFYHHLPREVYVSLSGDKGENWMEPRLLSEMGNQLSLTFDDSGNLLSLYNDFSDESFSVIFEKISLERPEERGEKFYLKNPTEVAGPLDYIGAFQKIIHTGTGDHLAFWIDYSDANKLYFSKW